MRKWVNSRQTVAILICILIGIALWEPVSAQPPVEPGWNVFTEPSFGYQIQYPEAWHVSLAADNTQHIQSYGEDVALRSVGFFGPGSQIVFVDVWINRNDKSLSDWMAAYPAPSIASETVSQTREVATIAGKLAFREVDVPADQSGRAPWHYRTIFTDRDLVFSIEYAALQPNLDLYERMLRSFRLVDAKQPRMTASTLDNSLPPASFGVQTATCCGITDPEFNPFPCNTAGDELCPAPPCGNCTWWVRYSRQGSNDANLIHCTNDALTWGGCVNQYYPHLNSDFPEEEAIVIYPGLNHLSFVEAMSGDTTYQASDLSWFQTCPVNNFSSSAGGGKKFVLHPELFVPNVPPNRPSPTEPADEAWVGDREVKLTWEDGGDPDDKPLSNRQFFTHIKGDDWSKQSGWHIKTEWKVEVPDDGLYEWRTKANDGQFESAWTETFTFGVDTVSPVVSFPNGQPDTERWYRTNEKISWDASDASSGSGIDTVKWDWDDDSPDKDGDEEDSTILSEGGQGIHRLYVQAFDKAGNKSAVAEIGWFGFDTIGPNITFAPENPTVDQWYTEPLPLAWSVADPAPGIGVGGSNWAWGSSLPLDHNLMLFQSGGAQQTITSNAAQGKHTLFTQPWDRLGNQGNVQSFGWVGHDSAAPIQPTVNPGCEAANSQWQNTCHTPSFTWHSDDQFGANGSGISQYSYVWSDASNAIPDTWSSTVSLSPEPIADPDGVAQAYLHVWSKDVVGHISSPSTFGIWYDGSIPQVSMNVLSTTEADPNIQLILNATDTGSGVLEYRIANNGVWLPWQPFTEQIDWILSAANNPTHTIDVQVRDGAGNESAIVQQTLSRTVDQVSDSLTIISTPFTPQPNGYGVHFQPDSFYANAKILIVNAYAPHAAHIRFSDDPVYEDADWQPYQLDFSYTLPSDGFTSVPVQLYTWFRDADGNLYGPYKDDVVYDAVAPIGKIKKLSAANGTETLLLPAADDNSGVAEMRIASEPTLAGADWEAYALTTDRPQTNGATYVQFRDLAGNTSPIYGTDGTDSSKPYRLLLPVIRR